MSLDALEDAEQPVAHYELSEQYAIARDALRRVYSVGAKEREVIFRRMAGESYKHIAAMIRLTFKCNYTVQAAHRCIVRMMRDHPMIADLFSDMREKQRRRRQR